MRGRRRRLEGVRRIGEIRRREIRRRMGRLGEGMGRSLGVGKMTR